MHQLKKGQEAFTVVEGPCKGMTFTPGVSYAEVPPGEAGKFTSVKETEPPPVPDPAPESVKQKTEKRSA